MVIEVEFTDRYGPKGPPSWLRGCHGHCEAMGVVPIFVQVREPKEGECSVESETNPAYLKAWAKAHAKPHHEEGSPEKCDGWHFVPCPSCRVPLWRSVALVPKWLWKGARFLRSAWSTRAPWMNRRQHAWLLVKCAWLYDLGWPQ